MSTTASASEPTRPVSADLRTEAERVLTEVGTALRAVLRSLYPTEPAPRDLQHTLDLHKTLCWRVLQVAFAREPLAAAAYVPGDEGFDKFLKAAGKAGAARENLDAVREALICYRALARLHAGDRASFEVMLMSLATQSDSAVELKAARRAGYRSTSYAWGSQVAARILCGIITPVEDDAVDFATLRGHVRARRVRKEGMLRLSRTVEHDTDAPAGRRALALPIVPESVVGGVPLLPDFCTRPLPALEAVMIPGKNVEYRFVDQPLGEQAAITVFTGEVRRKLMGARWCSEDNTSNALMLTIRDPVALGVIDLWAPPGFGLGNSGLVVSAVGVDPLGQTPDQWHVLPAMASVERLGRGLRAARLSEAPEYEGAIDLCFNRLGWAASDYELHRLRLEYPVLGSCLVLRTKLCIKPDARPLTGP